MGFNSLTAQGGSFHITAFQGKGSGTGQSRHGIARNSNWLSGDLHIRANNGRYLQLSQARRVRHLGHWEANDLPRTHVNTGSAQLANTAHSSSCTTHSLSVDRAHMCRLMAHVLATAHTSLSTSPSYQFRQHYAVGRSVALTTTQLRKARRFSAEKRRAGIL